MKKDALIIGYEGIEEIQVEGLDDLQRAVGGMVDIVDLPLFGENHRISLYVNDEGVYACRPNRALTVSKEMEEEGYLSQINYQPVHAGGYYSLIWGPIVAIGYDPETGDSVSLTEDDKQAVIDYFSTSRTCEGSGADLAFLLSLKSAI